MFKEKTLNLSLFIIAGQYFSQCGVWLLKDGSFPLRFEISIFVLENIAKKQNGNNAPKVCCFDFSGIKKKKRSYLAWRIYLSGLVALLLQWFSSSKNKRKRKSYYHNNTGNRLWHFYWHLITFSFFQGNNEKLCRFIFFFFFFLTSFLCRLTYLRLLYHLLMSPCLIANFYQLVTTNLLNISFL